MSEKYSEVRIFSKIWKRYSNIRKHYLCKAQKSRKKSKFLLKLGLLSVFENYCQPFRSIKSSKVVDLDTQGVFAKTWCKKTYLEYPFSNFLCLQANASLLFTTTCASVIPNLPKKTSTYQFQFVIFISTVLNMNYPNIFM